MPFNPCGFGVDFLRTPVTDYCRPFRDSLMVVKRRWYKCEPDAPILPFPTAFFSAQWEPFPWLPRNVGEVYPPVVKCLKKRVLWGFNFQHFCGTAEDFQIGAVFDPEFVQPIGPDWIPLCCNRQADATEGGIEIGGEAGDVHYTLDATEGGIEIGGEAGDVFRPPDATEGGIEIGGEAGDVFRPPDATEGGIEIGGEAGDVFIAPGPPCPNLTENCEDAPSGQINTECSRGPFGPAPNWWAMWTPLSSKDVRLTASITDPPSIANYAIYEGTTCADKVMLDSGDLIPGIEFEFSTSAPRVWFVVLVSTGWTGQLVTQLDVL